MLLSLSVQNFILIDRLYLEFVPGLNIITGASGAGKSIILDALNLIMGEKINGKIPRPSFNNPIILAAEFTQPAHALNPPHSSNTLSNTVSDILFTKPQDSTLENIQDFLAELSNNNTTIIIRRIINSDNKSRFYLNDIPCTSQQVRKLAALLTQSVRQNTHQSLLTSEKQRQLVDQFANHDEHVNLVKQAFKKYQNSLAQLILLNNEKHASNKEIGYLRYLIEEISKVNPQPLEEETLAEKRKNMLTSKDAKNAVYKALQILDSEQNGILCQLQEVEKILTKYCEFFTNLNVHSPKQQYSSLEKGVDNVIMKIIENVSLDLGDLVDTLSFCNKQINLESLDCLEEIEARLSVIRTMARKYGVGTATELQKLLQESQAHLAKIEHIDVLITSAEKEITRHKQQYLQLAQDLSKQREEAAKNFTQMIKKELADIEMAYMDIFIKVTQVSEDKWHNEGIDTISFMVRSVGTEFETISKVASGGEVSRLLLAMHLAYNQNQLCDTLIFDEIDIGIGGAVASTIGNKLSALAEQMQVISITHQPQVAAYADQHIIVYKNENISSIKVLNDKEREQEIGRMLSGIALNQSSILAAKAMISDAKSKL